MNRGDFNRMNAPALVQLVKANVTREALDEAFAAAEGGAIKAEDYLSGWPSRTRTRSRR